jgi:hypothetical protein
MPPKHLLEGIILPPSYVTALAEEKNPSTHPAQRAPACRGSDLRQFNPWHSTDCWDKDLETDMRKPVNILSLVAIAVAAVALWTFTQSHAVSQKFAGASAASINVLDLTMKASPMPSQSFAAH